jgi:hypothetical protein
MLDVFGKALSNFSSGDGFYLICYAPPKLFTSRNGPYRIICRQSTQKADALISKLPRQSQGCVLQEKYPKRKEFRRSVNTFRRAFLLGHQVGE